jgi:hypothetical protein
MANKRSQRNQRSQRNRRNRRNRSQRNQMRGGSDFDVPIRLFYQQNNFEHDPSREMSNSVMKGGSKFKGGLTKGGKKNHSRKYLKGGSFLNNFGSITNPTNAPTQIAGAQISSPTPSMPSYKV